MNSAVIPLRQSAIESSLRRAAFEWVPVPVVCLNGSAQVLAASRALADLLQLDPERMIGRHLSELLGYRRHRDFARRWAGFWGRLHAQDRIVLRGTLRLPGGRSGTFEFAAQRLKGDNDGVAVVTLRDLGAERAERRGRRDRLAIADLLLEDSGDVSVLLDAQRRVVLARGPHGRLLGDRRLQAGQPLDALLEKTSGYAFVQAFDGVAGGPAGGGATLAVRSASAADRELTARLVNRLGDSRIGAVTCMLRDDTERHASARDADRMRRRLGIFVEHSADLTLVLDLQGTLHFVAGTLRGQLAPTAAGVGAPFTELFEVEDHPLLQQTLQEAVADPGRSDRHGCIAHLRIQDGRQLPLWVVFRNVAADGGGALGGVLAVATRADGIVAAASQSTDDRHARRLATRERLLDLAVQSRLDFPQALASVLRVTGEALGAVAAFWRISHDPAGLHCEASYDPRQARFVRDGIGHHVRREAAPSLFARVAERQSVVLSDLHADAATADQGAALGWDGGALLMVPVLLDGETRGVVSVHDLAARRWREDDIAFVNSSALVTALAMEGAQRQQAETRLEQLAWYDPLTGLPNRNLLRENLRDLILTAGTRRRRIALMLIDLDRFKDVNDTLGHLMGDALIKSAGQVLRDTVGDEGLVARLGGDEFVVVLPKFLHRQEAALLAARITHALHRTDLVPQVDTQVSASIGIALFPEHGREISTLLKNADAAMYQAKRDGRNQFSFFNPIRAERAAREVQLGIQLMKALQSEHSQFTVEYQPQVEMATGRVIGLEALIRWQHPTLGLLTPDHFIGVAEVSGLSDRVTRWVVNAVCGQVAAWRAAWPGFDIPVSINVAGRELGSNALPALMRESLVRHAVPARLVVLEITERTLVSDGEVNNDVMGELAALGVGLSLDDFGTGYSTLGYLKRLPIQALKIDQSFVEGIPHDEDSCAIVKAMLAVARHFRFKVVAEGLENLDQVEYLRSMGCEYAQGYYYARALPAATILAYLEGTVQPGAAAGTAVPEAPVVPAQAGGGSGAAAGGAPGGA